MLRSNLARMAPGTGLRDGLERILRSNTGALIVLGHSKLVDSLCTGGFWIDIEFSATRLRELAKMDGAVVLSTDGTRIMRAGVHLMPDPTIPTDESGTRHRTSQQVSVQTAFPVIAVSESMHSIGLYITGSRYEVQHPTEVLTRANQALATLEKYKLRLDEVAATLSALEIEDLVTARDALSVAQRLEMVRRIASEIDGYVIELGTDGRLISLQLDELMGGVGDDRESIVRDYLAGDFQEIEVDDLLTNLADLTSTELLELTNVARVFNMTATPEGMEQPVSPRGFRLLSRVPRLPGPVVDRLVEHFGTLQKLLAASIDELQTVDGVGDARARGIRESLSRLAENSILDRYV